MALRELPPPSYEDNADHVYAGVVTTWTEAAYVQETPTGLLFAPDTPIEVWGRLTERLIRQSKRLHWCIADAINFGDAAYGETYAQWVEETGLSVQTLTNIAWIGRRIPHERRREGVDFSYHGEVAALEPEDQDAILDAAEAQGLKNAEVRVLARHTKREREREAFEALPVPEILPSSISVEVADATALPWPDGSVNLVVTSPPYGIMDGKDGVRKYRTPDDWRTWASLMDDFAAECWRILPEGGRVALNVPYDTWVGGQGGGQRSTLARAHLAFTSAGFTYVTLISWDEDNVSKSIARGSVDSPSAPRVMNRQEAILVFCKGTYGRLDEVHRLGLTTELTHEEWLAWTDGVWRIAGESHGWEGFAAAFPPELARRLITLFSFREDTIADPFVGSGTTGVVALKLGRRALLSDIDPLQVESTKRRLLRP